MIIIGVIEFIDRPGSPLFCIERFVEGDYVKHNSNSGFLEDKVKRLTPQTFSHFSFERAEGHYMVVDIQGVDDLYTDPQVHSFDGKFGSGDLSFRGMALFFNSHKCNALCSLLQLTVFDFDVLNFKCFTLETFFSEKPNRNVGRIYYEVAILQMEDILQDSDGDASLLDFGDEKTKLLCKSIVFLLHQGALNGDVSCLEYLTRMYLNRWPEEDNCEDRMCVLLKKSNTEIVELLLSFNESELGIRYLRYGSDMGCSLCSLLLGELYDRGNVQGIPEGVDLDWESAVSYYARAQSTGGSALLSRLGDMYSAGGYGLSRDIDLARDFYLSASNLSASEGDLFSAGVYADRAMCLQE